MEKKFDKLSIIKFVEKKNGEYEAMQILTRIIIAFSILHPKLYAKYFGWCSYHPCALPINDVLTMLTFSTMKELINFCLKKVL